MLIGFVGSGKIAQALIKGFLTAEMTKLESILASAPKDDFKNHYKTREIGCRTTYSNIEVVKHSEVVVLAVKPQTLHTVLADIAEHVSPRNLLISIVAGITLQTIEGQLPANSRVIRVMSNTPVLVRQGASVFALGKHAHKPDGELVKRLFESVGICDQVEENLIDAVTALSGSGPAYTYMCMEALADAGVREGIPRELAYNLAAHTVLGAARMVLETNKHPSALKDDVCSPSGCTINALYHLERNGFRSLLMDAVQIATKVSKSNNQ